MMRRLFIFNELLNENVKNIQIIQYVNDSFGLNFQKTNETNCLLNPRERPLNDFETSFNFGIDFDLDFNFFKNPILTSQRLKIGSQIFHSQDYSRVGPRISNFVIAYKNQNETHYGVIKYFLQIKSEIFLAINKLKIIGNLYTKTGGRTSVDLAELRDQRAFDKYFCDCREIENLFFIHSNLVISKCIAQRIDNLTYCLSELEEALGHS